MNFLKKITLQNITQKIFQAFKRFPIALSLAVLGSIFMVWIIGGVNSEISENIIGRIVFTSSLGFFLFVSLTFWAENLTKIQRNLIMFLGSVFITYYYFSLPDKTSNLEGHQFIILRHIFLIITCFISLFWVNTRQKIAKNESSWKWGEILFDNLLTTIFFGIIAFLGLSGAVFAVNNLFEMHFNSDIYFKLWVCVVGLFGPFYFLSELPTEISRDFKIEKNLKGPISILTKYILTPLALIYMFILYSYTLRIFITGEIPKNILGWLVIVFSVIAIITYFLWTPWAEKISKYRKWFWIAILPQLGMLFMAIFYRISQYGWTENRYFVVVLGLWLLGISLYFLFDKKARIKYFLVSLTLFILLTQYGPVNGYKIGKNSQQNRLNELLLNNNLLVDGKIKKLADKNDLSLQSRFEISDVIKYLISKYGKESVTKVVPQFVENSNLKYAADFVEEMGFDMVSKWDLENNNINDHFSYYNNFELKDIAGYDFSFRVNYYQDEKVQIEDKITDLDREKPYHIKIRKESSNIDIYYKEEAKAEVPLQDFFAELLKKLPEETASKDLIYEYESEKIKAKMFFDNIYGDNKKVKSYSGEMLLKIK